LKVIADLIVEVYFFR